MILHGMVASANPQLMMFGGVHWVCQMATSLVCWHIWSMADRLQGLQQQQNQQRTA